MTKIYYITRVTSNSGQSRNGKNVPRPGQVHSGTMKRPGINYKNYM